MQDVYLIRYMDDFNVKLQVDFKGKILGLKRFMFLYLIDYLSIFNNDNNLLFTGIVNLNFTNFD